MQYRPKFEILVLVLLIIVFVIKWQHKYWQRKGLPTVKHTFPFGNFGNPFARKFHFGILLKNLYSEIKQMKAKHGGFYVLGSPVYMPVDPDIIKNIMSTDFRYFHDRGLYYNEKDDPLSAHLFTISGSKWRNLRTKLTSMFTSGKIKMMFDLMVKCATNMHEAMRSYEGSPDGIEMKELLSRYTTDVIGLCAFGVECNSFKDEDAQFRKYGKLIFTPMSKWKSFLNIFAIAKPKLAVKLHITFFSKEVTDFFINVVKKTMEYRREKNVKRNDMLQLLIDLQNDELHDGKTLSLPEIAAQVFVFFIAGFDTSSSTMMFCLYELAANPEIQKKLRREIVKVLEKHNGNITYEAIMEMKYMGQVIDETLRKYPPLPFLSRRCVDNYLVPNTDITIEKGTKVYMSTLGLHHDPEYFFNPEKFDPDRFSEENRMKIRPFSYLPFGEGPRICIGVRFGLMQTKIGLATLLKNYALSLNNKTVFPFVIDKYNLILTVQHGIWLNIEKIPEND